MADYEYTVSPLEFSRGKSYRMLAHGRTVAVIEVRQKSIYGALNMKIHHGDYGTFTSDMLLAFEVITAGRTRENEARKHHYPSMCRAAEDYCKYWADHYGQFDYDEYRKWYFGVSE